MDPLIDPNTGNPGEATAQASPWVASAAALARSQQQQQAALMLEQQRAQLEQTRNTQLAAQTGRALASQGASGDASQWANNPAYAGQSWSAAPPEAKQHFMDAYATLPEGGNGISEQLPKIWNEAQRNATGNPQVGLENLQEGQTAQVDVNGDKISVGKPPSTHTDPATGRQYKIDPATGQATYIQIQDPSAQGASVDASGDPLSGLSPAESATVKGLANYTLPMSVISRMPPAQKERILQHAYAVDPNFDAQQYPLRQELKKSFTSGPDASNITSLNTVIGHIGRLADAGKLLSNSSSPMVNAPGNWINQNILGAPQQTAFDQAKTAVASEMAKLFKGTGSPTDVGVREWENTLSRNSSPEQLKTAISGALELMQSRADALRSKYENGFQKPNDKAWLNTQSKAVLRKLGVDPGALDPASGNGTPAQPADGEQPAQQPQQSPAQQSPFKTPEDVRDAFRAGTLPREQAESILKSQFGHQ